MEQIKSQKSPCWKPIVLILVLVYNISCNSNNSTTEGTITIEDYISQNKFSEARNLVNRFNLPSDQKIGYDKIYSAELDYWLNKKEFTRAKSVFDDIKRDLGVHRQSNAINIIVQTYCKNGLKEEALEFANTLEKYIEEEKYSYPGIEILNYKQYNEIKKELPENERIEPYHTIIDKSYSGGIREQFHKVFITYKPKTEALEFIKDCQNFK